MPRAYNSSPPKVEAGRSEVQGHRPVGRETSLRNYHLLSQYTSKQTKQSRFPSGILGRPGRAARSPHRNGAQFRKAAPRHAPLRMRGPHRRAQPPPHPCAHRLPLAHASPGGGRARPRWLPAGCPAHVPDGRNHLLRGGEGRGRRRPAPDEEVTYRKWPALWVMVCLLPAAVAPVTVSLGALGCR